MHGAPLCFSLIVLFMFHARFGATEGRTASNASASVSWRRPSLFDVGCRATRFAKPFPLFAVAFDFGAPVFGAMAVLGRHREERWMGRRVVVRALLTTHDGNIPSRPCMSTPGHRSACVCNNGSRIAHAESVRPGWQQVYASRDDDTGCLITQTFSQGSYPSAETLMSAQKLSTFAQR